MFLENSGPFTDSQTATSGHSNQTATTNWDAPPKNSCHSDKLNKDYL